MPLVDSTQGDPSGGETVIVLMRRSTRIKSPAPSCQLCDRRGKITYLKKEFVSCAWFAEKKEKNNNKVTQVTFLGFFFYARVKYYFKI